MQTKKLKYLPYGNAYVKLYPHINGGDICIDLISYTTKVLSVDNRGWCTCYGLYSMTTRKHISMFLREYANISYKQLKRAYENNYRINIYTGDLAEMDSRVNKNTVIDYA